MPNPEVGRDAHTFRGRRTTQKGASVGKLHIASYSRIPFFRKSSPALLNMMQLAKSSSTVRSAARYQASKVAKPVSAARSTVVPRASPSPPEDTNAGPAPPPGTIFYGELLFATRSSVSSGELLRATQSSLRSSLSDVSCLLSLSTCVVRIQPLFCLSIPHKTSPYKCNF